MSGRWLVILALTLVAGYQFVFPDLRVQVLVHDAASGKPLQGAQVAGPDDRGSADGLGSVSIRARPGDFVSVQADGYLPLERRYWPWEPLAFALEPRAAEVAVVDADSGAPLPVATVEAGGAEVTALQDGRYRFSPAREGVSLAVSAPGYLQAHQTYGGGDSQRLSLAPILRGTITDARTGRPIPGATVSVGSRILTADDEGGFKLPARVTSGTLWALSPGYRRAEADLATHGSYDLALEPFAARALYLTFFGVGNDDLRTNVISLLTEANGLNAVVIDVKGDRGYIAYPTKVELASRIDANSHHTIDDVDGLVRGLHARNVYVIARIVVMKDDLLARNGAAVGVDVAITKKGSHEPWIDGEGLGWVDPFKSPVWDYNVALAREAAEHGFDEVQFDYIRFPTDPASGSSVDAAQFSQPLSQETRVAALVRFLDQARQAVNGAGAYLSVDVFGYTTWADDDMGIGQHLASLAQHVDYICPMVYPSTFSAGLPAMLPYPDVIDQPYMVVHESLLRGHQRVDGSGALLRPWLQYFDDYPWATSKPYGPQQIADEVRAAQDAHADGFQLWDPTNRYRHGGVGGSGD